MVGAQTTKGPAMIEADASCPVPVEQLGELYRAPPGAVAYMLVGTSEDLRARLAVFCYGRRHFRDLAFAVTETVTETRLAQLAGTLGRVLVQQSRAGIVNFDREPTGRSRGPVSLAAA